MSVKSKRSWQIALLQQRCPRCREGRVFRNSLDMDKTCSVCGLSWEREEGYFLGAMYISYALAIAVLLILMLLCHLLLPHLDSIWIATLAVILFVPFVPMVFRYSRVIWLYFDHWAWPENSSGSTGK